MRVEARRRLGDEPVDARLVAPGRRQAALRLSLGRCRVGSIFGVVRVAALLPYPAEPPSSETERVWRSLDADGDAGAESEAALAAEFDAA